MNTLTEYFIENAVKSAILACFVALIANLPRVRDLANLQHSLWVMVLLAMIVPSVIEIPIIAMPASNAQVAPLQNESPASNVSARLPDPTLDEAHNVVSIESPRLGAAKSFSRVMIAAVWFGGTVCLMVTALRRVFRMRRTIQLANGTDASLSSLSDRAAKQLGIRQQIRVAIVQSVNSPFIWVDRRAIYIVISESICNSLSDSRIRSIMLHELSHYLRRDHWSNTFAFLVLALCWWNPVAWIAVRRMRALQEYCCDAIAIEKSQLSRREYAECIFQITSLIDSRNSYLPASACEFFGHTSFEKRFKMIANTRVGFKTTKAGLFMTFFLLTLLPCTVAFSQADKTPIQKANEKQAKDEAESKQWHDTMEKFNRLVTEGNWPKAEQLANETASKFGHNDALVQNMLLTSINGMRKSQGLAPIIVQKLVVDAKADEVPLVVLYSLKDALPSKGEDKARFVEILTHCILASIAADGADKSDAKVHFDSMNQGLIVLATEPKQKLASDILKRIGQKSKP